MGTILLSRVKGQRHFTHAALPVMYTHERSRSTVPFSSFFHHPFAIIFCLFCVALSPLQVNFNEPLSMLQRFAEESGFSDLLDNAAMCDDTSEEMAYVAAFSMTAYTATAVRTTKPFNPLLGETFELDRSDDLGWRSFVEQVCTNQSAVLCRTSSQVNFNEPLSYIQRFTETSGNCHVLDNAASCSDTLEELTHVAAFSVTAYTPTAYRTTKPFNPLLGETFECDRTDDLGWRSFAEQVCVYNKS